MRRWQHITHRAPQQTPKLTSRFWPSVVRPAHLTPTPPLTAFEPRICNARRLPHPSDVHAPIQPRSHGARRDARCSSKPAPPNNMQEELTLSRKAHTLDGRTVHARRLRHSPTPHCAYPRPRAEFPAHHAHGARAAPSCTQVRTRPIVEIPQGHSPCVLQGIRRRRRVPQVHKRRLMTQFQSGFAPPPPGWEERASILAQLTRRSPYAHMHGARCSGELVHLKKENNALTLPRPRHLCRAHSPDLLRPPCALWNAPHVPVFR